MASCDRRGVLMTGHCRAFSAQETMFVATGLLGITNSSVQDVAVPLPVTFVATGLLGQSNFTGSSEKQPVGAEENGKLSQIQASIFSRR